MAFDDTCSQCTYLDPSCMKKGLFRCTNRKSDYDYVSARMRKSVCDYYCAIGVGKRTTRECHALEEISKKYGYYIVTAIYNMLGLEDSRYMEAFMYIKDVFMPKMDEYESFLNDYEVNGPRIAELLEQEEDKIGEARYLMDKYLREFTDLVELERPDEAAALYIRMYEELLGRYCIVSSMEKPKRLLISDNK